MLPAPSAAAGQERFVQVSQQKGVRAEVLGRERGAIVKWRGVRGEGRWVVDV